MNNVNNFKSITEMKSFFLATVDEVEKEYKKFLNKDPRPESLGIKHYKEREELESTISKPLPWFWGREEVKRKKEKAESKLRELMEKGEIFYSWLERVRRLEKNMLLVLKIDDLGSMTQDQKLFFSPLHEVVGVELRIKFRVVFSYDEPLILLPEHGEKIYQIGGGTITDPRYDAERQIIKYLEVKE